MVMTGGTESAKLFKRALELLPGGVNSPVRAYRAVGGTPPVIKEARGAEIRDVDGNSYIDFVMSWGPLVLGHSHPEVIQAVKDAADRGTSYGAICSVEIELAEMVVDSYPGIEQVRCVSTGTEATMSAIRLARGVTGRDAIVKPSSAGVPDAFARLTHVLPLADEAAVIDLFAREGERIAAVIIEPVPANNGLLLQTNSFLQTLRRETERAGALLIFDEVITGFRLARGGAAERFGITPDLVTLGKVIGGGLPVGAFAGRRELMQVLAPDGPVYQPPAWLLCPSWNAMMAGPGWRSWAGSSIPFWPPSWPKLPYPSSWFAWDRYSGLPCRRGIGRTRPRRLIQRRPAGTVRSFRA